MLTERKNFYPVANLVQVSGKNWIENKTRCIYYYVKFSKYFLNIAVSFKMSIELHKMFNTSQVTTKDT